MSGGSTVTFRIRAVKPDAPASGFKLYTKASGLFLEDEFGVEYGPFSTEGNRIELRIIKSTPGTLNPRDAVYIVGYDSGNEALQVEPTLADAAATMPAIGVVKVLATDTAVGSIVVSGLLEGIDTSGFAVGDELFIDAVTPGAIVAAPPAGPNIRQAIAQVVRVHATLGILEVFNSVTEPLSDSVVEPLGTASAGDSPSASRANHVHSHGALTNPLGHALATALAHGFMSDVDKDKLDGIAPGAVSDHGDLTGLAADDHVQYVLRSILTTDGDLYTRIAGVIARLGIGTAGQVLGVSAGLPAWITNPAAVDPRDLTLFDHFVTGTVANLDTGVGWVLSAGGTGNNQTVTAEAGHPGILRNQPGTVAAGRSAYYKGDAVSGIGCYLLTTGQNDIDMEWLVRLNAAGILAANNERVTFGFGDGWASAASVEHANGVYVEVNPAASANFLLRSALASVRTQVDSGIAVVAGNWYRIGIKITFPGGVPTAQLYINGTAQGAAITATFPTTAIGVGIRGDSNAGANYNLDADYVKIEQVTEKET